MTTLTGRWVWGPASGTVGPSPHANGFLTYPLDDLNDAIRVRFSVPKDGTLSKIGVYIDAVTGTPPAYQMVFKDMAGNAYGGCAAQSINFTATGWQWITLGTPATASAGDIIDAVLEPTASAPDASNCVTVRYKGMGALSFLPQLATFTTSWILQGQHGVGVLYSDDSVAIPGVYDGCLDMDTDTTPDEAGGLFTLPFACKCRGIQVNVRLASAASDFTISLLDASNNVLGTATWDATYGADNGEYDFAFDEVSLSASTQYRAIIKPTTTTNVGLTMAQCDAAASKLWFPEGERWQLSERTDEGAWTNTATAVPMLGLILSEITLPDAGVSSGSWAGGMIIG